MSGKAWTMVYGGRATLQRVAPFLAASHVTTPDSAVVLVPAGLVVALRDSGRPRHQQRSTTAETVGESLELRLAWSTGLPYVSAGLPSREGVSLSKRRASKDEETRKDVHLVWSCFGLLHSAPFCQVPESQSSAVGGFARLKLGHFQALCSSSRLYEAGPNLR